MGREGAQQSGEGADRPGGRLRGTVPPGGRTGAAGRGLQWEVRATWADVGALGEGTFSRWVCGKSEGDAAEGRLGFCGVQRRCSGPTLGCPRLHIPFRESWRARGCARHSSHPQK